MGLLDKLGDRFLKHHATVDEAVSICGKGNVVLPTETSEVLGMTFKPTLKCPYQQEVLEFCAQQNSEGEKWKALFKSPLSPWHLHTNLPDEFASSTIWETKKSWLTESCSPGFRLLNFKTIGVEELQQYQSKFAFHGIAIAPAKVSTVAESLIVVQKTRNEYLLSDEYHCDCSISKKEIAVVGGYHKYGMLLYSLPVPLPSLRIVPCIVPQLGWLRAKTYTT